MKKNVIKILAVLLLMFCLTSFLTEGVFAVSGSEIKATFVGTQNPVGSTNFRKIIGIVLNAVRIVCVGIAIIMLIILAMKYMTSSPEAKADIKKTAITYVAGALIMFGASTIIGILQDFSGIFD